MISGPTWWFLQKEYPQYHKILITILNRYLNTRPIIDLHVLEDHWSQTNDETPTIQLFLSSIYPANSVRYSTISCDWLSSKRQSEYQPLILSKIIISHLVSNSMNSGRQQLKSTQEFVVSPGYSLCPMSILVPVKLIWTRPAYRYGPLLVD